MLNKMRKTNNKGFTLIELMIVIAIIGILAAIAIPNFIAYRNKSFCSAAESDANMIAAAIAGDLKGAEQLDQPLQLLHERLFVQSSPIPVKWALAQMGRIGDGIRLPLTWLETEFHETVREAMRQAGVIQDS